MKLVNFHYFYNISRTLQELHKIRPGSTIVESFGILYLAEVGLREFLANDLLPPQTCLEKCAALADLLDSHMSSVTGDGNRTESLSQWEVSTIQNSLREFETVLESEYRIKPVFAPSKKGLYSLEQLVFRGEEMVPRSVHQLIPGMEDDLKDACRCIAFEVPTAGAFHLFRATEAAVKAYIVSIRGTPITDAEKRWGLGGYRNILDGLGVDSRVTAALDQLTKLHRNPAIHPDWRVSNDEVLATLGMVDSFIRIVATDMQRRRETPNKPLDEFLPSADDISAMLGAGDPAVIEGEIVT